MDKTRIDSSGNRKERGRKVIETVLTEDEAPSSGEFEPVQGSAGVRDKGCVWKKRRITNTLGEEIRGKRNVLRNFVSLPCSVLTCSTLRIYTGYTHLSLYIYTYTHRNRRRVDERKIALLTLLPCRQ